MNLISGVRYNLRGIWLGIKTPKLLVLGCVRLFLMGAIALVAAGLLFYYHGEILEWIWSKPKVSWIQWVWYAASYLLSLFLTGIAVAMAYLLAQILFGVVIMDMMSRITERMITGQGNETEKKAFFKLLFYLIGQEVPRTLLPVTVSLFLMVFGWMTPLGPIIAGVSTVSAIVFLAWDSTDLLPARRFEPFGRRFRFLLSNLPFHIGFGLPFLVPGFNLLSLTFSPVGAALFHSEKKAESNDAPGFLV